MLVETPRTLLFASATWQGFLMRCRCRVPCVCPDGVTVGQAVDVVMKHLRDHPEAPDIAMRRAKQGWLLCRRSLQQVMQRHFGGHHAGYNRGIHNWQSAWGEGHTNTRQYSSEDGIRATAQGGFAEAQLRQAQARGEDVGRAGSARAGVWVLLGDKIQ